jgi:hypothetical protein
MTAILEPPVRLWSCPSCQTKDRTQKTEVHTQMHPCPGLSGLNAPLIEVTDLDAKVDARQVLVSREDYAGDKPVIASCRTDHGDGSNDLTVYAPTSVMPLAVLRPGVNRAMKNISVSPDVAGVGGASFHHRFHDPKLAKMARIARELDSKMAWTTSNGNAYYVFAMGANTAKPSTDAFKVALFLNAVVPAQSTTAAVTQYAGAGSTWSTANETTNTAGTAYTAGGVAVTPVSWTQTTNVVTFTSSGTPQWTSASFSAFGAFVYDTTATNQGISWNYFGGSQSVTSGTFSITWNASGIVTLTC